MKMTEHSVKLIFEDTKLMFSFIWHIDKLIILFKIIDICVNTCQTFLNTIYIKLIIDSILVKHSFSFSFKLIFLIQFIAIIVNSIKILVGGVIIPRSEQKIKNELQNLFIKKSIKHDLKCYEDFEFYDNYTKAMRYADTKAIDFLNILTNIIQNIVSSLTLLSVVSVLSPILFIFITINTIISLFDQYKSNEYSSELYEAEQSINRGSEYIKKISHHRQYAKEIRIFSLCNFIIKKLNSAFMDRYQLFCDTNKRYWKLKYKISIINSLITRPLMLLYLTYETIKGALSIGSFTILFGISIDISDRLSSILNTWSLLKFQSTYYVGHLKKILDYKSEIENYTGGKYLDPLSLHEIEFRNVTFQYPNHNEFVLKCVNFIIKRGQKIALVGRNGAGKSTIIKLLLRLYDITEGAILIDGINIKEYNIENLRKCFSVIMQDYNIYAFTIAENISMGTVLDNQIIDDALEFSGLKENIYSYSNNIYNYITREFHKDGIELSGGQSQKLAIARAYARRSTIFILDEANSSLDPIAEFELNRKILSYLSDKNVIFITHRLSTTIMADEILLIDKGMIIERGNHSDLMNLNGVYANMFKKQANAYINNNRSGEVNS